jgi:hypothetical protein
MLRALRVVADGRDIGRGAHRPGGSVRMNLPRFSSWATTQARSICARTCTGWGGAGSRCGRPGLHASASVRHTCRRQSQPIRPGYLIRRSRSALHQLPHPFAEPVQFGLRRVARRLATPTAGVLHAFDRRRARRLRCCGDPGVLVHGRKRAPPPSAGHTTRHRRHIRSVSPRAQAVPSSRPRGESSGAEVGGPMRWWTSVSISTRPAGSSKRSRPQASRRRMAR